LIVRAALEFDSHPPVEFMAAAVASRHHCIGKGEERSVITALLGEPLHIKIELAVEHRLQPLARDITLRVSIDSVTHFHVVSRHALRDRARRAADTEKPAHHLLPGADLSERSVPARIEIDLQRLRMGINRFLFHVAADLARLRALNVQIVHQSPQSKARRDPDVKTGRQWADPGVDLIFKPI
jgi:hypothetical protein